MGIENLAFRRIHAWIFHNHTLLGVGEAGEVHTGCMCASVRVAHPFCEGSAGQARPAGKHAAHLPPQIVPPASSTFSSLVFKSPPDMNMEWNAEEHSYREDVHLAC